MWKADPAMKTMLETSRWRESHYGSHECSPTQTHMAFFINIEDFRVQFSWVKPWTRLTDSFLTNKQFQSPVGDESCTSSAIFKDSILLMLGLVFHLVHKLLRGQGNEPDRQRIALELLADRSSRGPTDVDINQPVNRYMLSAIVRT